MNRTFKRWLTGISTTAASVALSVTAFAEENATPSQTSGGGGAGGALYPIFMILIFVLVGYFFLVRPEKKRKKEAETLRDNLKPGNRITTIGGIVGTVEKVTDEEIFLTNGLVLKRWALRTIDEKVPETSSAVTYYDDDEEEEEKEETKK